MMKKVVATEGQTKVTVRGVSEKKRTSARVIYHLESNGAVGPARSTSARVIYHLEHSGSR